MSMPLVSLSSPQGYRDDQAYLSGSAGWTNLSGIEQGTPFECVTLRDAGAVASPARNPFRDPAK